MTEIVRNENAVHSLHEIKQTLSTQPVQNHVPRIGLEFETLFHNADNLNLMSPDQSQFVLKTYSQGKNKITYEDANGKLFHKNPPADAIITTIKNGKSTLSLELSGVLEIATDPFRIGQEDMLLQELDQQRETLYASTAAYGLIPCPFSTSPHATLSDVKQNRVARQRLRAGYDFFEGTHHPDRNRSVHGMISMGLITSNQISIEASHTKFDEQMRYAFMLQPLFYALCSSHCGYSLGNPHPNLLRPDVYLSYNNKGQNAQRSGVPSFVFNYDQSIAEGYAQAVLKTPMLFCYDHDGKILDQQKSFEQLQQEQPDLATGTNLNAARSLLFYDVKLHQTSSGTGQRLEIRSPDSGPGQAGIALLMASACLGTDDRLHDTKLALIECGLLEDPRRDQLLVQAARTHVSRDKLATPFGRKTLSRFAHTIAEITDSRFRHCNVDQALDDLHFIVETGLTNTHYAETSFRSLSDAAQFTLTDAARLNRPLGLSL